MLVGFAVASRFGVRQNNGQYDGVARATPYYAPRGRGTLADKEYPTVFQYASTRCARGERAPPQAEGKPFGRGLRDWPKTPP